MDDSFKLRVDKVFGSLLQSRPASSESLRPCPWSVSDEEVEHRKWKRERGSPDRDDLPCSSFNGFFSDQQQNGSRDSGREFEQALDDLDDASEGSRDPLGDAEKEEWEIRGGIGMDATLDNEDEEDGYDKVAVGRENTGDRLYMRDINKSRLYLYSYDVLFEDSIEEKQHFSRDPRADHLAATTRLQEDKETYKPCDSPQIKDDTNPVISQFIEKPTDGAGNVKSILKRKEADVDLKPKKRVRFDTECEDRELQQEHNLPETRPLLRVAQGNPCGKENVNYVPDYVRNPQNYTCYSLESTNEDDDDSNKQAYQDFLSVIKNSRSLSSESVGTDLESDMRKSVTVTFIPKKKIDDATMVDSNCPVEDSLGRSMYPLGIAAGEQHESEACAMEEDVLETLMVDRGTGPPKPRRRYRTKPRSSEGSD